MPGKQSMKHSSVQQQDRRQACLTPGLTAESAGCEAQRAEQPADDHPQRLSRTRSVLDNVPG